MRFLKAFGVQSLIVWASCLHAQQEPQYALSQFNHFIINPAYAGLRSGSSVLLQTRQQWIAALPPGTGPKTYGFSAHGAFKSWGFGTLVISDQIGARSKQQYGAALAYHLKSSSRSLVSFGVSASVKQYQFKVPDYFLKVNEPSWVNMNSDPMLNIDAGVYFKNDRYFASVSVTQLNTGTVMLGGSALSPLTYIIEPHYIGMSGRSFVLSEQMVLSTVAQCRFTRNSWNAELQLHALYGKWISAGLFYRYQNGIGFLFQTLWSNGFRVAYSFELNPSNWIYLGSTHELGIGMDLGKLSALRSNESGKIRATVPRFL
jgi:type IX secretion system PorP/SprF family membrane protein